ncbi:hypothetical protein HPB47_021184 [Ixodes persulcatus]|uniref:Uncharacterized protein n=1 Tax=Ixodes persulcatus TaxID=34615 RepID=A0AC60QDF2_IXOPE|nr:hypothetical protein HPB47_021184 [Ixodes persulcatus]
MDSGNLAARMRGFFISRLRESSAGERDRKFSVDSREEEEEEGGRQLALLLLLPPPPLRAAKQRSKFAPFGAARSI